MSSSLYLSSVKMYVPLFDEKESSFAKWYEQFKAYGTHKGFLEVLTSEKPDGMPEAEESVQKEPMVAPVETATEGEAAVTAAAEMLAYELAELEQKEQLRLLLMNQMAIAAFSIAFQNHKTHDCMNYIKVSRDDEWPSGKAWEVVEELHEEYAPSNKHGQSNMRKELHEISMKRWDNPKTLFSQIVTIETRYRGRCEPLKDSDKLHALRDALPQQYQWTILSQEQAAEDNGTTVCLKKLRKGLSNVYDME